MDPQRRRVLQALASLPVAALLGGRARAAERPPRRVRTLDAPIILKSGDLLENLELRLSPRYRWQPSYAVIYGGKVQDVTIRNVRIEGSESWLPRWQDYHEPKGTPRTGIPSEQSGIRLQTCRNITLDGLEIEGFPRFAITGFGLDDCVMRDIQVTRCRLGIATSHYQPSHRLLVEKVRVHDTWGPAPGLWPGIDGGIPSKVRPGTYTGGNGIGLDTVREGVLRDCDVRGEHWRSYKLVNPQNLEAARLVGNGLMVQGTADEVWKIHKEPARDIRLRDCVFDKSLGTGKVREIGNGLQISWHVHGFDARGCKLDGDGQGGHGIQLAVDAHANVVDCTFEDFNGMRGGERCYAADVREGCTLNADFETRNTFVDQQRKAWRRPT